MTCEERKLTFFKAYCIHISAQTLVVSHTLNIKHWANASNYSSNFIKLTSLMVSLLHLHWLSNVTFLEKWEKKKKNPVWWSLMASKLFIKQKCPFKPKLEVWWRFVAFAVNYIELFLQKQNMSAKHRQWSFSNVLLVAS